MDDSRKNEIRKLIISLDEEEEQFYLDELIKKRVKRLSPSSSNEL